jgi:hypothetical protein
MARPSGPPPANPTNAQTLATALLWRSARQGFGTILAFPWLLALFVVGVAAVAIWQPGAANFALPDSGAVLGVHLTNLAVGLFVLCTPFLLFLGTGLSAGMCVMSVLGSEMSSGGLELWLSRLDPRSIAAGLWAAVMAAVGTVMLGLLAIVAGALAVFVVATGSAIDLGLGYILLCVVVPIVLAGTGAAAAIGVGLWRPRLGQSSSGGLVSGSGGLVTLVALAPSSLMCLLLLPAGQAGMSSEAAVLVGLVLALPLGGGTLLLGITKMSRDQIVSSL